MKKALLVSVVLSFAVISYSQEKVNALYPSELLIESFCPVDTGFAAQFRENFRGDMYFSLADYTKGRLPYIFTEMAANPNLKVYSSETITDFYPYDMETYDKSDMGTLFTAFGGDTVIVLGENEGEEVKMVQLIDTLEMMAVSFVEEWQLDTVRPAFSKKVKAIVPIRCYKDAFDRSILRRTCIITQSSQAKKREDLTLVARVKYEFSLFPQGAETHGFLASEELFGREIFGSPFFSSYSRNMLIKFLESSALSNRTKCYDFSTGNAITDKDTKMKGFGYSGNIIVIETGSGEFREATIIEKIGQINSVIFFEEWYLDSKTGQFSKNVTAIAPVLWDPDNNKRSAELFISFDEDQE